MKKILSTIFTMSLIISIFAFASIGVGAANITEIGQTDQKIIKGTYVKGAADIIYSVDIAWGSMEFTYTSDSQGTWNPDTYVYDNPVPASWTCDTDANKVTVTNHSNEAIMANFEFVANSEHAGVQTEFYERSDFTRPMADSNDLYLDTAEAYRLNTIEGLIDVPAGPRTENAYIKISSGELTSGDSVVIGTVTVTINESNII